MEDIIKLEETKNDFYLYKGYNIPFYAMFLIYLFIFGGFTNEIVPCKIKFFLQNNIFFKHIIVFFTILFSINITIEDNYPIFLIFISSIILYLWFLLSIRMDFKCWILFMILLICLYLIYLIKTQKSTNEEVHIFKNFRNLLLSHYDILRNIILIFMLFLTILGNILYYQYQRKEKGKDFSWITYFFGKIKCDYENQKIIKK